jgi:hypothetical protein
MLLHSAMLTLQSLVAAVYALTYYIPLLNYRSALCNIVITVVDLIVQLVICYICLTMGSNVQLCKFQMTLDLTSGVPKVVFSRTKESVRDTEI